MPLNEDQNEQLKILLVEFEEVLADKTLPENPAQKIGFVVNALLEREIAENRLTLKEANDLQKRLGYLAFNMIEANGHDEEEDTDDSESIQTVDKDLAAAWLYHIREDETEYEVEDYYEPEASPDELEKAAILWSAAEEASFLNVQASEVNFYDSLFQQYFCARFCQSLSLNLDWADRLTWSQFSNVWAIWNELDNSLINKLVGMFKKASVVAVGGKNQQQQNEANVLTRVSTTMALGYTLDPRAMDTLLTALKDQNYTVRSAAVDAVAGIADGRVVPQLLQALRDKHPEVRASAVSMLGFLEETSAVEPLIMALRDRDAEVRVAAADALGILYDERAIEPLLTALHDRETDVRAAAADALGFFEDYRIVDALSVALKDPEAKVRQEAAYSLGLSENERAVEPLLTALRDRNRDVRARVIEALGMLGDQRALPALESLLPTIQGETSWGVPLEDVINEAIEEIQGFDEGDDDDDDWSDDDDTDSYPGLGN